MTNQTTVSVPNLGVNDELATLVKWTVEHREAVRLDDIICVLETTKAVFDVEAQQSGFLGHLVTSGTDVLVNQAIAVIAESVEEISLLEATAKEAAVDATHLVTATKKAERLAEKLGVDLAAIHSDVIIREKDVEEHHRRSLQESQPIVLETAGDKVAVAIYGAGQGAVTLHEALHLGSDYHVVCFVDDDPDHGTELLDLPVYHGSRLKEIRDQGVGHMACEIAVGAVRLEKLKLCVELGLQMINVIHPTAYVAPSVIMGDGNYIKARAVVETNTVIGNCCIIDNGAIVAHDCELSDGCHLTPGVSLGSNIRVGELSIIGIGASVATGITIGSSALISMGSSVVKNVPDHAIIEGVPGRVIGQRK